jgi:SAM-dependent methyltransferase
VSAARENQIEPEAVDYSSMRLPPRLLQMKDAAAQRARRKMFERFTQVIPTNADTLVLDVGVTPERRLLSNNFFENLYQWKHRITATSHEDASVLEEEYPGLRFVRTDGNVLPFDDKAFDVVFSSAVIEHVGDRARQQAFVNELLRVGRRFFLTTPNRWFPLDLHTALPLLHWAPRRLHQSALRLLRQNFWASTDNLNLLSAQNLRSLFPATAQVELIRFRTGGLTSNLIAYGSSDRPEGKS